MKNQLVKIVNESGLEKPKAQVLLEKFTNYFENAPDKQKLIEFADNILCNTAIPVVKSDEAKQITEKAKQMFQDIVDFVKEETEKL